MAELPALVRGKRAAHGSSSIPIVLMTRDSRRYQPTVLRDRAGYQLTLEGRALLAALMPLDDWALRWSERSQ